MKMFTDDQQRKVALMNIEYYDSIGDYMKSTFSRISTEEAEDVFIDEMERGFIQNITCGTYNGASDTFDPWELTDANILNTIHNNIMDDDFYNFVAAYMCDDPEEAEELKEWTDADFIREYTEVYNVFIIGNNIYVNID